MIINASSGQTNINAQTVLKDKVAIIAGATSGIGAECAKVFCRQGAKVIIVGRNKDKGNELEGEINKSGGVAKYVFCDLSKENDIVGLITVVVDTFKKIDILLNNAGVFHPSVELDRLNVEAWQNTFQVNLDSYLLMTKYAMPYLLSSSGVILNNASIAGMHSYATGRSYAYSASKAAVIQLSRMLAKNYAPLGVRVNCICPGVIETPLMHGRDLAPYRERIPAGRIGTPTDVAQAALFLCSDYASYINGAVLPIDGGASL
jgi:meso-butanediol dehydrogenase/(S,S)-butanediol dehydrogenase/diacetyl reductase